MVTSRRTYIRNMIRISLFGLKNNNFSPQTQNIETRSSICLPHSFRGLDFLSTRILYSSSRFLHF